MCKLLIACSYFSSSLLAAKKYNELFPKDKKEKPKKGGSEVGPQGKGAAKKPEKTAKKKPEAAAEEEEDTPKPAKFVDPYANLPQR